MEAALTAALRECGSQVTRISVSNTLGLPILTVLSPLAPPLSASVDAPLLGIALASVADLLDHAIPASRTSATVAKFQHCTIVQTPLFPLILSLVAEPHADVDACQRALIALARELEPMRLAASKLEALEHQ